MMVTAFSHICASNDDSVSFANGVSLQRIEMSEWCSMVKMTFNLMVNLMQVYNRSNPKINEWSNALCRARWLRWWG